MIIKDIINSATIKTAEEIALDYAYKYESPAAHAWLCEYFEASANIGLNWQLALQSLSAQR